MKKIVLSLALLLSAFVSFMPTTHAMVASNSLKRFRTAVATHDEHEAAANYYDLSESEQRMARYELKIANMTIPGIEQDTVQPVQQTQTAQPATQKTSTPLSTPTPTSTLLSSDEMASQVEAQLTLLDQLKVANKELEAKLVVARQNENQIKTETKDVQKENAAIREIIAQLKTQTQKLQTQINLPSTSAQSRDLRITSLLASANNRIKEQLQQLELRKAELRELIATAKKTI